MPKPSDSDRYARYHRALNEIIARDSFSLGELKAALSPEKPVFVTRLVRELEKEGYLREAGKQVYEWTCGTEGFPLQPWLDAKVYGPRITRTPEADRPRERLLALDPPALRTAELLAILVRSGRPGESALQTGERIAARFADGLEKLPDAGRGELKKLSPAVGKTAYCQIMAGIELGRRVERAAQERKGQHRDQLRTTKDALAFCQQRFARLAEEGTQEEFRLVSLDAKRQVIGTHVISVGLLSESLVGPREVFRPAIRDAAAAVILVHNHPSGDPTPSPEDLAVTRRMDQAAQTIGIKFVDHLIVARQGCVSIREHERA